MNKRRLSIHLNDQRAFLAGGKELANRSLSRNANTSYEAFLREVALHLDHACGVLDGIMDRSGIRRNRIKSGVVKAAERVGRLKFNGRLTGYSPLSRCLEIQGLSLVLRAESLLWSQLLHTRLAEPDTAGPVKNAAEDLALEGEGLSTQALEEAVLGDA